MTQALVPLLITLALIVAPQAAPAQDTATAGSTAAVAPRPDLPQPLTCLLRPARSSEIGADTGGIVAQVAVRRASRVSRGDLLVQIDDRIAQAELAKATIAHDVATENLRRAEAVTAGRVISREEMASLRGEAAMAAADLTRARLQVERAQILAPFDGTVAEVMTEAGQLINVDPLVRLIDTHSLRAEIVFPAEAFGRLHPGDTLPLAVDLTGARVTARVATIDNYIDSTSNSFSVEAEFDNPDGQVPAGTGCRIDG